jgi:MtN3 and saliva related transmembrane protein
MDLLTWIGGLAAALTSLSYLPQVKKAWPRGSTDDLSLNMLIILTSGLWLWSLYGVMKGDWVIIAANVVGGTLSLTVLLCKLRDIQAQPPNAAQKRVLERRRPVREATTRPLRVTVWSRGFANPFGIGLPLQIRSPAHAFRCMRKYHFDLVDKTTVADQGGRNALATIRRSTWRRSWRSAPRFKTRVAQ